jgi:hypothetical protein
VVPVNPKGGTTFDYESVTSIAAIGLAFEAAMAHACSRAIRVCARAPRSDNLSDMVSTVATALKRCRI